MCQLLIVLCQLGTLGMTNDRLKFTMKTNNKLQDSLGFSHQAHKVYYAALVLKAALTPSAAVLVRQAVPADS